jgi:hypothetical protein
MYRTWSEKTCRTVSSGKFTFILSVRLVRIHAKSQNRTNRPLPIMISVGADPRKTTKPHHLAATSSSIIGADPRKIAKPHQSAPAFIDHVGADPRKTTKPHQPAAHAAPIGRHFQQYYWCGSAQKRKTAPTGRHL